MPDLSFRLATLEDAPFLNAIILDYRQRYFTDYDQHNPEDLIYTIKEHQTVVITADGIPIGGVWFLNVEYDLHAQMYVVIEPQYLLAIRRQGIFEQVIDRCFVILGVRKIKAMVHEELHGAYRYLRDKLKFYQCGFHRNETRVHGRLTGVYSFELHQRFWERKRNATEDHQRTV